MKKPTVVCLCGSTRFKEVFIEANRRETLAGKIVLTVGTFPHAENQAAPEDALGVDVKAALDELHKRKIDLADEILVLNVGGYVGSSTRGEIAYASETKKPFRFWGEELGRPSPTVRVRALESLLLYDERLIITAAGRWEVQQLANTLDEKPRVIGSVHSADGGYAAARAWLEARRPE